jgi:hypothetical protein
MKEEETVDTAKYVSDLRRSIRSRKLLEETVYGGWGIRLYFGPAPEASGSSVSSVEFVCIAEAKDHTKTKKPDLSKTPGALRTDFDNRSVIIWTSNTRSMLTRMLKSAFNGFNWESQHGR